jgi:hypothetical protein
MAALTELATAVGTRAACLALWVPRGSYYRDRGSGSSRVRTAPRPNSVRALAAAEREMAPLTAPPVTTGSIQHERELALGGLNTRKTDKSGGAVGRPSCQSSLLSDPNAKCSAKMWRNLQRTRKIRRAATSALTFMTFS